MSAKIKEEIVKVIAPFLECEEFYARYEAVKALGMLARLPSPLPLSSIAANPDEDIDMRVDAIESMVKIGDPQSHGVIISLLSDINPDIRLSAIRAASRMGINSATDKIIVTLAGGEAETISDDEFEWDRTWDIELEAVKALGKIGGERAALPLIRLYEDEMPYDLAEDIFKALCQIGSDEAITFLKGKLTKGVEQERRLIVQAIGNDKELSKKMEHELREAIGDEKPSVRIAAIEAVAATCGREAMPDIEKCLYDPDPQVRAGAMLCLIEPGSSGIEEKIVTALADPSPIVRSGAAVSARDFPTDKVKEQLLYLLKDPVEEVALNSVQSYVLCEGEGSAKLLANVALNNNRSPYMRIECLRLIGSRMADCADGLLPSPLDVEPRQVSIAVASCLITCPGEEVVNDLVNDLRKLAGIAGGSDDENEATEFDEEEVNVKIGKKMRMVVRNPGATPGSLRAEDLIRVLSGRDHPEVRAVLGECVPLRQSTIASAAVRAMGEMGVIDCEPVLVDALDHPSAHVRAEAAQALGRLNNSGDEVATKLGELAVLAKDQMVRQKSMSAIGYIKGTKAKEYLLEGLSDAEPDVRQSAIIALGNLGDARAVEPLVALLFNYADFTHLRGDIYKALARLDLSRVKSGLLAVLDDKSRSLDHWVAIEGLGQIFRQG